MITMEPNPRTIYDLAEAVNHTYCFCLCAAPKVLIARNIKPVQTLYRLTSETEERLINHPKAVEEFERWGVVDHNERLGLLYYYLMLNYVDLDYQVTIENGPVDLDSDFTTEANSSFVALVGESVDAFGDRRHGVYYVFDDIIHELDLHCINEAITYPPHYLSTGKSLNYQFPSELYIPVVGPAAAILRWLEEPDFHQPVSAHVTAFLKNVYEQIIHEYLTCGGTLKLLVE